MEKIKLSNDFSLDEFLFNHHGIVNIATVQDVVNMVLLCQNVLQPLRNALKVQIKITSGFRCAELNNKIGGARKSQHLCGQAADIWITDRAKMFNYIKDNLNFDQLIWEGGNEFQPNWVHVSFCGFSKNRKQILYLR